jgi:hypothetical protein
MKQLAKFNAVLQFERSQSVGADGPGRALGEALESVLKVNELPWIRDVEPDDVRLGYARATSLGMWLFDRHQEDAASPEVIAMLQRIEKVSAMTFAEEIADIVVHAVDRSKAHRSEEAVQRWAQIFTARYLAPTGKCRDRSDVGAMFACSTQRVSQICGRIEAELIRKPYVVPALQRVLQAAEQLAPCSVEECNETLASLLGEGAGIESVLNFADYFDVAAEHVRVKVGAKNVSRTGGNVDSIVLLSSDSWKAHALRFVKDDCALLGCTSVQRVAGHIALELSAAPGKSAIEFELQRMPGFTWLSDGRAWFTVGDQGSTSCLADRVRKMMAAATKPIELSEIGAALITDTRWLSRIDRTGSRREASLPALHVLQALMMNWAWLRQVQYTRFESAEQLPGDVLTEAEARVVELISERGGVACTHEIVSELERELGLALPTATNLLSASPIIKKVEYSTYAIRGREIADTALEQARRRSISTRA